MKFGVNDISHLSGLVIGFYYRFRTFPTDSLGGINEIVTSERGQKMYVAIQEPKRIEAAQKKLVTRLNKALPARPETFTIGHQGDNFEVDDLRSNGIIWFAHHVDRKSKVKRNWNGFGIASQLVLKGSNKIVTEANVALDGKSQRVAGLFAEDDDTGNIVLLHRGKVGGSKKGIGMTAFLTWYKGPEASFIYAAKPNKQERALVVADLDSADIAKQVGEFVTEVFRFKSREFEEDRKSLSDAALTKRAKAATRKPRATASITTSFARDLYVSEYAERRAKGKCDLCHAAAPFSGSDGNPYLECHHIDWLANNGPDAIENTVALCPNCHRRMHIVKDPEDIEKLRKRATRSL